MRRAAVRHPDSRAARAHSAAQESARQKLGAARGRGRPLTPQALACRPDYGRRAGRGYPAPPAGGKRRRPAAVGTISSSITRYSARRCARSVAPGTGDDVITATRRRPGTT